MRRLAKVLRYVGFMLMALFGLLGGMFAAGAAFDGPGGWRAVAMTALWVLPLIALSVFALRRPAAAGPVFVGATVLVVLFTVVDFAFCLIPRDGWGPVAAVAVFAICVALAFLGLHPAALAGLLMVAESFRQSADLRIERSLLTGESLSNRLRLGATPRDRLWMSAGPRVSSIPAPSSVPLCGTRGRARSRPRLPTGTCPQRSLQSSE